MQNNKCYRFEKLEFTDGLIDLDATYIIHLDGNSERLDNINNQLSKYHPTNIVYILHNKGYKTCEKNLHLNEAKIDLIDAFLYIFKDAQQKNYGTILILEDDFIFDKKIRDVAVRKNITNFIKKKEKEPMIYMLGCLPFLQQPYDYNNNKLLLGIGTHACIYTKNIRDKILQEDQTKIIDWDYHTLFMYPRYLYHLPLCYQLFPETENQKDWFYFFGMKNVLLYLLEVLQLDKQVEPGYSIFYKGSKILYALIILFIVAIIVIFTMKKLRGKK